MGPLAQRLSLDVFPKGADSWRTLLPLRPPRLCTGLGQNPSYFLSGKFLHFFPQEPMRTPARSHPAGLAFPPPARPHSLLHTPSPVSVALMPASESRRYASLILEVQGLPPTEGVCSQDPGSPQRRRGPAHCGQRLGHSGIPHDGQKVGRTPLSLSTEQRAELQTPDCHLR